MKTSGKTLTLAPIGVIRTKMRVKFDAPSQPENAIDEPSTIELIPGKNFEQALADLEGFDRVWLVWWFDRNTTWKPLVLPPRGAGRRRGVFATRSPHRPNPLGITAVRLLGISGRTLTVGNTDLLDGTAILDIKPYLSEVDAFPDARSGWLEEVKAELSEPPRYSVVYSDLAAEQIAWLKERWSISFAERASSILERDPRPHRTRRITRTQDGALRMGCGAWRLYFLVDDTTVTVTRVTSGYPSRSLTGESSDRVPDRDALREFELNWPEVRS